MRCACSAFRALDETEQPGIGKLLISFSNPVKANEHLNRTAGGAGAGASQQQRQPRDQQQQQQRMGGRGQAQGGAMGAGRAGGGAAAPVPSPPMGGMRATGTGMVSRAGGGCMRSCASLVGRAGWLDACRPVASALLHLGTVVEGCWA